MNTRRGELRCFPRLLVLSFAFSGDAFAGKPRSISDLKSDERVVFFPTVGYPAAQGEGWDCLVRGWVNEAASDSLLKRLCAAFSSDAVGSDAERASQSVAAKCLLAESKRRKHIVIRLGSRTHELPETDDYGLCLGRIQLSANEAGATVSARARGGDGVSYSAVLSDAGGSESTGEIHLLAREGLSVVSDIDDTIKLTGATRKECLFRNTFVEPYRAVPGMADLYRKWAREPGAAFHYVSANPWQLYEALNEFLQTSGFPAGSYDLQPLRMKAPGVIEFMTSTKTHKLTAIAALLDRCPRRRFLLVGDSGQDDPEIYGGLARQYIGRIQRILIRDVTAMPRDDERYRRAFKDLPGGIWVLFRDASEIPK